MSAFSLIIWADPIDNDAVESKPIEVVVLDDSAKVEDISKAEPSVDVEVEVSELLSRKHNKDRNKNKDKNKGQNDRNDNHHSTLVVVDQHDDYEDDWVPPCPGRNEYWSTDIKCDVHCDFDGDDGYDNYDGGSYYYDNYNNYNRYRSGRGAFHDNSRCFRSVSDVLIEQGDTNVTTRETLGYPPEPKEEYQARIIDLEQVRKLRRASFRNSFHHQNDDRYVVIEEGQRPIHPPRGRCICKNGFARLNGKCVRYGFCPREFMKHFAWSYMS